MLEIFYNPIFIAVMFIFFFAIYRHSTRWILEPIELEMLVHNISLTSYKLTRWFFILLSFLSLLFICFSYRHSPHWIFDGTTSKTVRYNISIMPYKITRWFFILIPSPPSSSLHTDTHDIGPWLQSNRKCWCTTSCWCFTK